MNHRTHSSWQQTSTGWQPLNLLQQQMAKGSMRVGDAERDEAAAALGEHFASGRIDRAEYDERLELAFAARTGNDLVALFRDLPQSRSPYRNPAHDLARMHSARRGRRIPFLPVLLILIGLAVVFNAGWIIWVGLGTLLLVKKMQWERRRRSRSRTAWS
jgi:hypothetical protein